MGEDDYKAGAFFGSTEARLRAAENERKALRDAIDRLPTQKDIQGLSDAVKFHDKVLWAVIGVVFLSLSKELLPELLAMAAGGR